LLIVHRPQVVPFADLDPNNNLVRTWTEWGALGFATLHTRKSVGDLANVTGVRAYAAGTVPAPYLYDNHLDLQPDVVFVQESGVILSPTRTPSHAGTHGYHVDESHDMLALFGVVGDHVTPVRAPRAQPTVAAPLRTIEAVDVAARVLGALNLTLAASNASRVAPTLDSLFRVSV